MKYFLTIFFILFSFEFRYKPPITNGAENNSFYNNVIVENVNDSIITTE